MPVMIGSLPVTRLTDGSVSSSRNLPAPASDPPLPLSSPTQATMPMSRLSHDLPDGGLQRHVLALAGALSARSLWFLFRARNNAVRRLTACCEHTAIRQAARLVVVALSPPAPWRHLCNVSPTVRISRAVDIQRQAIRSGSTFYMRAHPSCVGLMVRLNTSRP